MNRKKALRVRTSDYTRAGHAAFQRKFSAVAYGVLSHPEVFTDIPILPSELAALAKRLMAATSEAGNGGSRASKNERNILRARATAILNILAHTVELIAAFAPTEEAAMGIMNLSGFAVIKTKYTRINSLEQVKKVKGNWTGNIGQALIQWEKIRAGVSAYIVEITFSNAGESPEWHFVKSTSRSKIILSDLPHLAQCWVRITAIGTRNKKSVPSDPALISIRCK